MKTKRDTILIVGSANYARPFAEHGKIRLASPSGMDAGLIDLYDVKLVVFTGGHDVDPQMYGEKRNPKTISNYGRDIKEQALFDRANKSQIPMVGICRGSQFLTVMNGGSLVQHVTGHAGAGAHPIITKTGKRVEVTSTHHQMMNPGGIYSVIAWAEGLSDVYEGAESAVRLKQTKRCVHEPEVVWYNVTKSLAVQFHPEYMNEDTSGYQYFQELLKEYVV